ncbi:molybdenum cofactor synthesis domain-containing protein [Terriglobus aquaticus]|uniref:Molybdenum cofactor biosynthesis protein B n=1 Tax=Terriglobus aquaticus TaxID=940139 RepID=A0ABW9KP08_9BACT|nr:molybdenum cofactor synthesis domain-containing protein [Terriglobus aquaticus]
MADPTPLAPAAPAADDTVPASLGFAVLTVSDTRAAETDSSGDILADRIRAAGHQAVARALLRDDAVAISAQLREWIAHPRIHVVVSTGGTGVTGRDVTPEAFRAVLTKELPGFGEVFRALSFRKIGLAAIQSRALGGVAENTYLFALPGSNGAVRDAWDDILSHLFAPGSGNCNLAVLIPRLEE